MTAVAFDTLKLARKLRDTAQMSQAQAEGVADALAEAMSGAELATKTDIALSEAAIKAEIAESRTETLRWVFAAIVGQTALLVTLLKLWH